MREHLYATMTNGTIAARQPTHCATNPIKRTSLPGIRATNVPDGPTAAHPMGSFLVDITNPFIVLREPPSLIADPLYSFVQAFPTDLLSLLQNCVGCTRGRLRRFEFASSFSLF